MLAEQASHARAGAALTGLEAATIGCVPAASIVDQLGRLATMLETGQPTREEFDHLKAALIAKT